MIRKKALLMVLLLAAFCTSTSFGYGDWIYKNLGPGVVDNLAKLRPILREKVAGLDFHGIFSFIHSQLAKTTTMIGPDRYPVHSKKDGTWFEQDYRVWIGGHWVGMLWMAYRQTGDERYKQWAQQWAGPIALRTGDTWTHDHGFLFGLSFVKGAEILNDPEMTKKYHAIALQAAETYTLKANPINGIISWHDTWRKKNLEDETVIDSMMDVQLMWWAAETSGDPKFLTIGLSQVEAVRKYIIRPDFSSSHAVTFNPQTGEMGQRKTFQGWADGSTWSRGQAWAIYGFSQIYYKTGKQYYLDTARGVADWFIERLPSDNIPLWDFDAASIPTGMYPTPMVRDSSAAAIAASGLLELARFETDDARREKYARKAVEIMKSLSSSAYLARGTRDPGLILHGCQYFKRQDRDPDNIDSSNAWGDYYYYEALDKLDRWR